MAEPKILNIKLAEYTPVSTVEKLSTTGWLQYGVRNDFPNYLIELAESTAVHGVLCKRKTDMIAGKGLTSNNQAIIEKYKLDDAAFGCADDVEIQGGYWLKVNYTTGGDLFTIKHVPFSQLRLGMDKEDNITGVWFSKDWSATNKTQNKPVLYPLFDPSKKPTAENGYTGEPCQFYYNFGKKNGVLQYPKPDYWGAINDIETIRQIGLYHSNTYLNGLFPSFIINFKNGIPDEEKIAGIEADFQRRISGAKNTGKYIIFFGEPGTDTSPEITAFPMTEANTAYIELSSKQAMQNVFIGHSVTTPRLFGIADAGNGLSSNTDEMKQGLQIMLTQVIEPKQRMISDGLEKILAANGINIEIDFIPNTPIDLSAPTPVKMASEKKKCSHELTEEESALWLEKLSGVAEVIDTDEWELLSECQAADTHEDELLSSKTLITMANEGSYANGGDKSKWGDAGLYKLRYAYSQNIAADSREFCKRMVALSLAGNVFRYEDIQAMGDDGVNGNFAPEGLSTYDIFEWKGGVYCHHFWKRQIYFRKRDANGKILPNDGLNNDIRVANVPYVPKKGFESVAPIKTPSRGSLKYD